MTTDLTVGNTILEQLGGRRFIAMTGANSFTGRNDGLSFRLPSNSKDGANVVQITLTPLDTYTFETFSLRRVKGALKLTPKSKVEDVYCDTLQAVFTSVTGLYTRL